MIKWIEIDTKAIKSNIKKIKKQLKNKKLMVVVKANAYGHGAFEISKISQDLNVDFLGAMNIYETLELREKNIKTPIMLLSPFLEEDIKHILKSNIIATVDKIEQIKLLEKNTKKEIKINIDVDTGLKRWGVELSKLYDFVLKAKEFKKVKIFSISTHIAYTPYKNMIDAREKLERFMEETNKIKKIFPDIIVHAANSLVFLDFPQFYFDMIRIGNLIYGIFPRDIYSKKLSDPIKMGIKRPWKFCAKIISIKNVKKGDTFGYASEIVATKNMRIATLPVGYSDGIGMEPQENVYQITEGKKYWATIDGKIAHFISKPSISHTLIDITNIPQAKIGTVVTLAVRRTAANSHIPRIYI